MTSPRHPLPRLLLAAGLTLVLAGCGMVNWSISNASDGCSSDPKSTIPCP